MIYSVSLCSIWLTSLKVAYVGRAKAFHWTPALRKKPTGLCSTALGQSGCTIAPTMTVSDVFNINVSVCVICTQCKFKYVFFSFPSSAEGHSWWHACFWWLLLHTSQPQHLWPIRQLLLERALRRSGARPRHQVPGPLWVAVRPCWPLHWLRPGWPRHYTQQFTVQRSHTILT